MCLTRTRSPVRFWVVTFLPNCQVLSSSFSCRSKKKIKHPGQLPSTDIAISGPSLSVSLLSKEKKGEKELKNCMALYLHVCNFFVQPKEGLYRKLTAHQEYINTRMDLILSEPLILFLLLLLIFFSRYWCLYYSHHSLTGPAEGQKDQLFCHVYWYTTPAEWCGLYYTTVPH